MNYISAGLLLPNDWRIILITHLKEMMFEFVDWMHLAQDGV
jgi:hypothetical protein